MNETEMKSIIKIRQLKAELRKQMKAVLAGISIPEQQRQSDAVFQKVFCLIIKFENIYFPFFHYFLLFFYFFYFFLIFLLFQLLKNEIYKNAKNVSIFLSMGTEINTEPIIGDLFRRSCNVFVPRFRKGAMDMEMVKLHSMNDYQNLPEYLWGIRQPPLEENRETAFDAGS